MISHVGYGTRTLSQDLLAYERQHSELLVLLVAAAVLSNTDTSANSAARVNVAPARWLYPRLAR